MGRRGVVSLSCTSRTIQIAAFCGLVANTQVLDKGVRGGGGDFWCSEEDGGYREENEDDFEDNTGRAEPTDDRPVELASAKHGEGDYGQMMIFAQRATTP